MQITVTDQNTDRTATCDSVELADTIRSWFSEAPADVEKAITDLQSAVESGDHGQHGLAEYLGVTVQESGTPVTVAHYELDGRVFVATSHDDGSDAEHEVGHYDADGGEWEAPVAAMLRKAGYELAGAWGRDGDDSIIAVRDINA